MKNYWSLVFLCFFISFPTYAENSSSKKDVSVFDMPQEKALHERGKKAYEKYCIGCHGVKGDGKGVASEFLVPKPRDFTKAQFRFNSRPSGSLPTDQDLFYVITHGFKRSSMPAWPLIPEGERWALVQYIKTFAPDKWEDADSTLVTGISDDPFIGGSEEEAIKKGQKAYHGVAACYSCHPAYISVTEINEARIAYNMPAVNVFRENLYEGQYKETSDDGVKIKAPDFRQDLIKRGTDLRVLYVAVANGISGTAMPTWKGILSEEDLWGMAYYVRHLASERKPLLTDQDIQTEKAWKEKMSQDILNYINNAGATS